MRPMMRQCRALSCGVLPATCLPHALLTGPTRWQPRISLNASLTARQHSSIVCHSAQAASPAPALGTSSTIANGEDCLRQAASSPVLYCSAACQRLTTACADSAALLLEVSGMKCGGCSASVKRILEGQPEVQAAAVNLLTESAVVRVPGTVDLDLFGPQAAQALTQKVGCRDRMKLAHSCLLGAVQWQDCLSLHHPVVWGRPGLELPSTYFRQCSSLGAGCPAAPPPAG